MSDKEKIKRDVIRSYGGIATGKSDCGCCSPKDYDVEKQAERLGYSEAELESVPEGANMGLGCGNPGAIANLKPGEVVLDLGAGGGIDCFLAAKNVGETGKVIGVDMTPDMVAKSRKFIEDEGYSNVEFRLGEIENLPAADDSVDVIISNCVINLSPDKGRVYREAFRVLKPDGRLAISDIVRIGQMPEEWKDDPGMHCSCVSGAASEEEIRQMLTEAGFGDIEIRERTENGEFIKDWAPESGTENVIASAEITAVKGQGA